MSKQQIKQLIENRVSEDGMVETGVKGVQLFRHTAPFRCAPAVYEPAVIAIVSGAKEVAMDDIRHVRYAAYVVQIRENFVNNLIGSYMR